MPRTRFVPALLVISSAVVVTALAQTAPTPAYDIVFTSSRDGRGIYRMRGDGAPPTLVVAEPFVLVSSGSWSPDGSKIAHYAVAADDGDVVKKYQLPLHFPLHIMSADGTGHQRLLDFPVAPFIAWSPDSTRVAVASGFEDPRLGDP